MADCYTCKYSYRYTSEIIYALQRLTDIHTKRLLKVLSFGCGPCTDLFAFDYLKNNGTLKYAQLEYHGIDYSKKVWDAIHRDIRQIKNDNITVEFFYEDACQFINTIGNIQWIPDLMVFQYVFSDMRKHLTPEAVTSFISKVADYINSVMRVNSYIILNDVNLGIDYRGGREYFDKLHSKLNNVAMQRGRFCNDNSRSSSFPRGYNYGDDSDGEFPANRNFFIWDAQWQNKYSPFDTCASAQMLIKR
jgi:SAM-dependent methyltransferase